MFLFMFLQVSCSNLSFLVLLKSWTATIQIQVFVSFKVTIISEQRGLFVRKGLG
jgi:hypothetical protein